MPFKSKAQQKYLFKFHPSIAKEFAHKTPNIKGLPEHAAKAPTKSTAKKRTAKKK